MFARAAKPLYEFLASLQAGVKSMRCYLDGGQVHEEPPLEVSASSEAAFDVEYRRMLYEVRKNDGHAALPRL